MSGRIGRRGLTLTELLVVAAVLTIVLVLLLQLAQHVRDRGLARFTRSLLAQVQSALDRYQEIERAYPPDCFSVLRIAAAGPSAGAAQTHRPGTEGVECLVRALAVRCEPFWQRPQFERAWANSDGDSNRADGQPLWELVDGWGRPLLYYNGRGADPAGAAAGLPLAEFDGLNDWQLAKMNDSLSSRWVHNDRRPLIDSAGPDGVFNNSDDILGDSAPRRMQRSP